MAADEPSDELNAFESIDAERPASSSPTESSLEQQVPGGHDAAAHDPYEALRLPQYRLYAFGSVLAEMGQQLQSVAVGWEVAMRGRNPALSLSFVGLVGAAPVILLALPAGQLADRVDRKRLTIITALAGALCSFGLAWLSMSAGPLLYMYGVLLLGGIAAALGGPARSALLPQVVPIKSFSNAATWMSSIFQVASVTGPAVAGFVIGIGSLRLGHHSMPSLPLTYVLDGVFGIAFAALLVPLSLRPLESRREPATLKTLLAGIRFVRINQIILATITLDLFAVLLGGATYLLPLYAKDILHVGAVGFGWLRAAPAVGAFVMAMLIAHTPPMKKAGRNLLFAVAGFGLATVVFGWSRSFPLSFAMLLLTGAFDNVSVVVRHTLVQVLTPDDMRGRVSAVNNVFIGASNQLGGWESGLTASIFGPVASVVAGGIGTILVVIGVATIWPAVATFGSLRDAKPIVEADVEKPVELEVVGK